MVSIIGYFFVLDISFYTITPIISYLTSFTTLVCGPLIKYIISNDPPGSEEWPDKSIAKFMFVRWKLKLGWGKFCVVRKKGREDLPWFRYRLTSLRSSLKQYYDDTGIAAHDLWIARFVHGAENLNYMSTLLIRGRKYDFPRTTDITIQGIKEHIEHCLEIDKAFYG